MSIHHQHRRHNIFVQQPLSHTFNPIIQRNILAIQLVEADEAVYVLRDHSINLTKILNERRRKKLIYLDIY